ncbi:MAG TPA: dual specificity protein phosphatase family protein [Blastocatellia bacterium]|nr:dual specificity protein phosphatase family protein [Blastocatellia bacterium]
MKSRLNRFSASVVALALLVSISVAQTEVRYKELPNFRKVQDHLYRGGQPGPGGLKKLAEMGIKTVVNLRGEDDLTRAEAAEAKALGLRYYGVPMPGLSRPTDAQVKQVMAILDDQENGPVFIHCKHGSDRTGTIIACYRIAKEKWTGERAIAEARQYGMSWVEVGMRDYIADYARQTLEKANQVKAETNR